MGNARAAVGVYDHWGWAILITVAADGSVIDRRRVELIEAGLPAYPHHHDAQVLDVAEAVALVENVARAIEACAKACLEALATSVAAKIDAIALRANPPLPATITERLADYRAQNVADSVMYRDALARAAKARGWRVHAYEVKTVLADAATALGERRIDNVIDKAGTALGRPWTKDHRVAMAAAIAAGGKRSA